MKSPSHNNLYWNLDWIRGSYIETGERLHDKTHLVDPKGRLLLIAVLNSAFVKNTNSLGADSMRPL